MMQVRTITFNHIPDLPKTAAACGFFDGFHTGHRQLIETTKEIAAQKKIQSAILTFYPDPWLIFKTLEDPVHLTSLADKMALAASFGIDQMYIVDFTKEFARLEIDEFHRFLKQMHIEYVICGFDFTYGYKGLGNVKTLQAQKELDVTVVESINDMEQKISSSRIERLLRAGMVSRAARLLGMYYSIPGVVVKGYQRGSRLLGFPTANLQPEEGYLIPARGVYAGYVLYNHEFYPAMINVGSNPTFGNDKITIEGHLLDFDRDIYGAIVRFFFVERLRPEVRFQGVDDLKNQLQKDKNRVPELLNQWANLYAPTVHLWSLKSDFDIIEG